MCRGVAKPMLSIFSQQPDASSESDSEEGLPQPPAEPSSSSDSKMDEDENPF